MSIRTPSRRWSSRLAGACLLALVLPGGAFAAPRHKPAAPPAAPALPVPAPQPSAATPAELMAAKLQRIQLPGVGGKPFYYTLAVPADWVVYEEQKVAAGMWVGPPGVQAGDSRMVYVRVTTNSLASAEAAAASIRRADAADSTWSASSIEIKQVGRMRGLLVQIDANAGSKEPSTLSLRLPLPSRNSAEFWFAANRYDFAKLQPFYERILATVQPFK